MRCCLFLMDPAAGARSMGLRSSAVAAGERELPARQSWKLEAGPYRTGDREIWMIRSGDPNQQVARPASANGTEPS